MDSTNSQMISYAGETGTIDSYLARPEGKDPRPGVIVIHEIYGLDDHIKDVANRFAGKGYVALAPHLFSGDPELRATLTPKNIGTAMQLMMSIPRERMRDPEALKEAIAKTKPDDREALERTTRLLFGGLPRERLYQDLVRAYEYLNSQDYVRKGKVGSVGFCFGGGMSINLACRAPVEACVIFYGENPNPIDLLKNVKGAVLGLYGAEDQRINADLDKLVKIMAETKKDFEMKIYPGAAHAFFNDTRERTYNAAAAKDSWDRVLRFFERTLMA